MKPTGLTLALLWAPPTGPTVDTSACPQLDHAAVVAALHLELDAEPDAADREGGTVVVHCTEQQITIDVRAAGRTRRRTIEQTADESITERSLALAIAPLFAAPAAGTESPPAGVDRANTFPAETPGVPAPQGDPESAPSDELSSDEIPPDESSPDDPSSDESHLDDPAPEPGTPGDTTLVSPPVATSSRPPDLLPPSTAPSPVHDSERPGTPSPSSSFGLVALLRPMAIAAQASGVGTQLGVLWWPSRRVGVAAYGTVRWGRTRRDRGTVDAWVAGAGPALALRLGAGRIRGRIDVGAALVTARLNASTARASVVAGALRAMAVEPHVAAGVQLSWPRVVVVPQLVIGATPGAPRGAVSGERDVVLALPYGGIGVSIEPWIWRRTIQ